ncbi:sugar phosphate isomerase/epimerase [bacterium]|nr:sugar phosphate isomerase/epimerase [bacterium]
MASKITRRKAVAAGVATTAALWGSLSPQKAHALPELGPDLNLVRDLKPGNTPIRIGGGFRELKDKSLTESVIEMKKRGYTGFATSSDRWLSASDSELRELRTALKEHDVVFFEVTGYRHIIHPDASRRQKELAVLARCIEAADKIGCPMVGTCTGCCDPNSYINVHPDNWSAATWKMTVEGVKQVLKDTAGMKAALGIEAQITTNIGRPKDHKRLMDDVGDPRCAVNLDPVNMMSLDTYYHSTELLNECFDLLGEKILGSHSKDSYIVPDEQTVILREVCSGRGVLDYETYLVRLSRMKWPRTIHPEHVPEDQLIEAAGFLRKMAAKVGVKVYG